MICSNCNATNQTSDFCTECGKPINKVTPAVPVGSQYPAPISSPSSSGQGLAITGFVLSLVGFLVLPIPFGLAGVVTGSIARKRGVKGLAVAAVAIGIVNIVYGAISLALINR
jgi:hypothetical protein